MVRIRCKVTSKTEDNSVSMMNAEENAGLSLKREGYEGMRVCITLPQVILYKRVPVTEPVSNRKLQKSFLRKVLTAST